MNRVTDWARAARDRYACPVCLVAVGARCVVLATGKPAKETHVGRWAPLSSASVGYDEGHRDTVASEPLTWYDLVAVHQVAAALPTLAEDSRPGCWCQCGAFCPTDDGGHPGHIIDVMHEHDMVVARLA